MPHPDWSDLLTPSVDRAAGVPLSRQLYEELRQVMVTGAAPPGSRLPATRMLAGRLGMSRTAVVAVYEQLAAEGYVSGRTGAGTFVTAAVAQPAPAPARSPVARPGPALRYARLGPEPGQFAPMAFNIGRCTVDAQTAATWRRLTAAALRQPDPAWLGYADPCGSPRLRLVLARYLRAARGVVCDPAQIMVVSGIQGAIDLLIKVLLEPGDPVWIEDPAYPALHAALRAAQARVVAVPVDAQGLDVAAGVAACPAARAAYVTPSHQSPSGAVMSLARRRELLAWARDTGSWVIEDDYDSEFRYAGRKLASLQGMDRGERVIYLGTFSKVLFPGLRLGYAVVPWPLLDAMAAARFLSDRHGPGPVEAVMAAFMENGHFTAHLRRMNTAYQAARDVLVAEIGEKLGTWMAVVAPEGGMHLLATLRGGLDDTMVARAAFDAGVVVRALSRHYVTAAPISALTLGFTGFTHEELRAGVDRLAGVLRAI